MNEYCGYPAGDCVLAQGDKKIIGTCGECKHWTDWRDLGMGMCKQPTVLQGIIMTDNNGWDVHKDFGCIHWEEKK